MSMTTRLHMIDPDTGRPLRRSFATTNLRTILGMLRIVATSLSGVKLRKCLRAIKIYSKTLREADNHNVNLLIQARAGRDKDYRAYIRAVIGEAAIRRWIKRDEDYHAGRIDFGPAYREAKPRGDSGGLMTPITYVWKRYKLIQHWHLKPVKPCAPDTDTENRRPSARAARPYRPAIFHPYELEPGYEPAPYPLCQNDEPSTLSCHLGQGAQRRSGTSARLAAAGRNDKGVEGAALAPKPP